MKSNRLLRHFMNVITCWVVLLCPLGQTESFGESSKLSSAPQEAFRLGERIYREGVLPSGERLRASVKGGQSVPGMTFACASCHLRSGLGALEESVYTPPISGEKLFRPLQRLYKGVEQNVDPSLPLLRPAYTDESLMAVIRTGIDPAGRTLNDVMPRFLLDEKDARLLVDYLRSLSSQFSPGVSDTAIRFATVISEDVKPELRDAMLTTFDNYFKIKNNLTKVYSNPRRYGAQSRVMQKSMSGSWSLATRDMFLSRWTLKGPPETWRGQLEEYYRKEPVFALLGGMVNGQWRPVHQFCEDNGIPSLFPNTEFPVITDSDWYTLYLSKGYFQEGEGVARYLNSKEGLLGGRPVVQIVRDSREAEALSDGFSQTWHHLGQQAPVSVVVPRGKVVDNHLLEEVLARHKPAALIIWDDAAALPALEQLSGRKNRPEMVFLSARYLGESLWTLKEPVRDFTYLAYPYAFSPSVFKSAMGQQLNVQDDLKKTLKQADVSLKDEKQKITGLTSSLTQLLTVMLMELKSNYYRDRLLDVIGMMTNKPYPLFGQISFGAGSRYVTKGCFIVQLSKGDNPELIKKSAWEIQ